MQSCQCVGTGWQPRGYIPLAAVLLLVLLPFYDRTPERSPLKRPLASGIATAGLAAIAFLTYQGATAPPPPKAGAGSLRLTAVRVRCA